MNFRFLHFVQLFFIAHIYLSTAQQINENELILTKDESGFRNFSLILLKDIVFPLPDQQFSTIIAKGSLHNVTCTNLLLSEVSSKAVESTLEILVSNITVDCQGKWSLGNVLIENSGGLDFRLYHSNLKTKIQISANKTFENYKVITDLGFSLDLALQNLKFSGNFGSLLNLLTPAVKGLLPVISETFIQNIEPLIVMSTLNSEIKTVGEILAPYIMKKKEPMKPLPPPELPTDINFMDFSNSSYSDIWLPFITYELKHQLGIEGVNKLIQSFLIQSNLNILPFAVVDKFHKELHLFHSANEIDFQLDFVNLSFGEVLDFDLVEPSEINIHSLRSNVSISSLGGTIGFQITIRNNDGQETAHLKPSNFTLDFEIKNVTFMLDLFVAFDLDQANLVLDTQSFSINCVSKVVSDIFLQQIEIDFSVPPQIISIADTSNDAVGESVAQLSNGIILLFGNFYLNSISSLVNGLMSGPGVAKVNNFFQGSINQRAKYNHCELEQPELQEWNMNDTTIAFITGVSAIILTICLGLWHLKIYRNDSNDKRNLVGRRSNNVVSFGANFDDHEEEFYDIYANEKSHLLANGGIRRSLQNGLLCGTQSESSRASSYKSCYSAELEDKLVAAFINRRLNGTSFGNYGTAASSNTTAVTSSSSSPTCQKEYADENVKNNDDDSIDIKDDTKYGPEDVCNEISDDCENNDNDNNNNNNRSSSIDAASGSEESKMCLGKPLETVASRSSLVKDSKYSKIKPKKPWMSLASDYCDGLWGVFLQFFVPLLIFFSFGIRVWSLVVNITKIHGSLNFDQQELVDQLVVQFKFKLLVQEFLDSGAYFMGFLVILGSCALPFLQHFLLLVCWWIPLPMTFRGHVLFVFDQLGKLSFIDIIFLCLIVDVFKTSLSPPQGGLENLTVLATPQIGVWNGLLATCLAICVSQFVLTLHNRSQKRKTTACPSRSVDFLFHSNFNRASLTSSYSNSNGCHRQRNFKNYCFTFYHLFITASILLAFMCIILSCYYRVVTVHVGGFVGDSLASSFPQDSTLTEKHYTIMDLLFSLPSNTDNDVLACFVMVILFISIVVMPCLFLITFSSIWFFRPKLPHLERFWMGLTEATYFFAAWSCMDVLFISLLASTLQIGIVAQFAAHQHLGSLCDQVVAMTGSECLVLTSSFEEGTWWLLAASLLLIILNLALYIRPKE